MHALAAVVESVTKLPKRKAFDLTVLCIYFIAVFVVVSFFPLGPLVATLLFYAIPGLYLIVRHWRIHAHAFLFSIAAGLATGFPLQIMAEINDVWKYQPVFGFVSLRGIPLEAVGWYVLWIGFTVTVYQVFFEKHRIRRDPHLFRTHWKLITGCGAVVAGSVTLLLIYPEFFVMSRPYLVFGTALCILPMAVVAFLHPHILRESLKAGIFLIFFSLLFEIIGLGLGWWKYPGVYVGSVGVFGAILPFEEILFFIVLGSLAAITVFEDVERR